MPNTEIEAVRILRYRLGTESSPCLSSSCSCKPACRAQTAPSLLLVLEGSVDLQLQAVACSFGASEQTSRAVVRADKERLCRIPSHALLDHLTPTNRYRHSMASEVHLWDMMAHVRVPASQSPAHLLAPENLEVMNSKTGKSYFISSPRSSAFSNLVVSK